MPNLTALACPEPPPSLKPGYYSKARLAELQETLAALAAQCAIDAMWATLAERGITPASQPPARLRLVTS